MWEIKYQGRKKTRHVRLSVMFFPSAFERVVPLPDVKYPSIYKVYFGFNLADSPCSNAHDEIIPISQSASNSSDSRKQNYSHDKFTIFQRTGTTCFV